MYYIITNKIVGAAINFEIVKKSLFTNKYDCLLPTCFKTNLESL